MDRTLPVAAHLAVIPGLSTTHLNAYLGTVIVGFVNNTVSTSVSDPPQGWG